MQFYSRFQRRAHRANKTVAADDLYSRLTKRLRDYLIRSDEEYRLDGEPADLAKRASIVWERSPGSLRQTAIEHIEVLDEKGETIDETDPDYAAAAKKVGKVILGEGRRGSSWNNGSTNNQEDSAPRGGRGSGRGHRGRRGRSNGRGGAPKNFGESGGSGGRGNGNGGRGRGGGRGDNGSQTRLSAEERQRYIAEGRCFRCGKTGHQANDHDNENGGKRKQGTSVNEARKRARVNNVAPRTRKRTQANNDARQDLESSSDDEPKN